MRPVLEESERRLKSLVAARLRDVGSTDGDAFWSAVRDIGVVEFSLPEHVGGVGLGQRGLAIVYEELGRALLASTSLTGALIATDWIWYDCSPQGTGHPVLAELRRSVRPVDATVILPWRGAEESLRAESPPQAALSRESPSRGEGPVRIKLERGGREHVLPGSTNGDAIFDRALDRAQLRDAAFLVGVACSAHELSLFRACERQIAGKPLIERQTIAHSCARLEISIEMARLQVHRAAWLEDTNGTGAGSSVAKLTLAEAARVCLSACRFACQVFGAAGSSHPRVTETYIVGHRSATLWGAPDELMAAAAAAAAATTPFGR